MSELQNQKSIIRKKVKDNKKNFSFGELREKSKKIFEKVENLKQFHDARIIFIYWSLQDEVYTLDFIVKWANSKQFLLPVINSDKLNLKRYDGVENLEMGKHFKIAEPTGEFFIDFDKIDLVIVPGISFDKRNNRLGRGKAYYDKFLKKIKSFKIGVCFDFQLFDEIPSAPHDVKMDKVICG